MRHDRPTGDASGLDDAGQAHDERHAQPAVVAGVDDQRRVREPRPLQIREAIDEPGVRHERRVHVAGGEVQEHALARCDGLAQLALGLEREDVGQEDVLAVVLLETRNVWELRKPWGDGARAFVFDPL